MLKQQDEQIRTSPMKMELSELQTQMKQYPFENFTAMPLQQPEQSQTPPMPINLLQSPSEISPSLFAN